MELKIQQLQIKAGKYKVVLNTQDAKELGIREGEIAIDFKQDVK